MSRPCNLIKCRCVLCVYTFFFHAFLWITGKLFEFFLFFVDDGVVFIFVVGQNKKEEMSKIEKETQNTFSYKGKIRRRVRYKTIVWKLIERTISSLPIMDKSILILLPFSKRIAFSGRTFYIVLKANACFVLKPFNTYFSFAVFVGDKHPIFVSIK